jgi:hypothetical protein
MNEGNALWSINEIKCIKAGIYGKKMTPSSHIKYKCFHEKLPSHPNPFA